MIDIVNNEVDTKHMKKILIVISNLEFGGAQRQIIEVANNIDLSKCELHICSLSNYVPLSTQLNANTQLHIIEKKFKFDVSVVMKLAKLIRQYDFNVIHSFLFDAEIATRLAAKLSRADIKTIGSERNANYKLKSIQKKAYRLTKNMVDHIIANSQSGADYNAAQTGVSRDKYSVIYNGVNTQRFKPTCKETSKIELGLSPSTKVIGMFASFKEQKNHPYFIQALKKVMENTSNLKVLLVGDMLHAGMHGSDIYCDEVKQQIIEANLEDHIIYLGNRNDVENIYPACDFTVLPSLFEGTPNVVLESMACGVPVIATNVSDNALIINSEQDGIIIELDDVDNFTKQLSVMLDNSILLNDLAKKARARIVSNFSSEKLAENMLAAYS